MFSFKLVSSSIRGASALASSQIPTSTTFVVGPPADVQQRGKLSYAYHAKQHQATRSRKLGRTSATLSPEEEAQLPPKPKKPVTPWILFVRERKDSILTQKDNMNAAELAIILAREWKQIDKTKYEQAYKQSHEKYMRQLEDYEKSLTDEQRDLLDLQKSLQRETKTTKMLRKTNPPVLPRNSANLYCKERSQQDDFKEMLKYKKPAEIFKDIFKEYREMSDTAKQRYIDMQEEDKSRFQHEFIAWFEGVQNNENLTKAARDQANALRDRVKSLNYI